MAETEMVVSINPEDAAQHVVATAVVLNSDQAYQESRPLVSPHIVPVDMDEIPVEVDLPVALVIDSMSY